MAKIVLGSYMARYPLGGMMSWVLQYLVGFRRLGHEVYLVEKSVYENDCFHPLKREMTNDCHYGMQVVHELLGRHGLEDHWCFVDYHGTYHGLDRDRIEAVFREADLFIDMGVHGSWSEEASHSKSRVLMDGEPGYTQIKMELKRQRGKPMPDYDYYYTAGINIAHGTSSAPTAGKAWRALPHPVVPDLFTPADAPPGAAFTTIMNWKSHDPIVYQGKRYGPKGLAMETFLSLPREVDVPMELAVAGKNVPWEQLAAQRWSTRDAHEVTRSFDSFAAYLQSSLGEFSICKEVFVRYRTGWFSDRSAAYLATGKPVVLQDTGFGEHLPCGRGLFAVDSLDAAREAIVAIRSDYEGHAQAALHIARTHLNAEIVLKKFLRELGL